MQTQILHCSEHCVLPNGMKSIEECCKVPKLFDDEDISACGKTMCKSSKSVDCVDRCLLENNQVVVKNEVNSTALEVLYSQFGLASKAWTNITHTGLQHCKLDIKASKNYKEAMDKFNDCMNSYFLSHCVEFHDDLECDKVEDFMEDCLKVQYDCDTWPTWIVRLPETCCPNEPSLFTSEQQATAEHVCQASEDVISHLGKLECKSTHMLNASGIHHDNQWNFDIVPKLLNEHSKDAEKWKNSIANTSKMCEAQVHGKIELKFTSKKLTKSPFSDDESKKLAIGQVDFWFTDCINGTLADFCPEFDTKKKKCRQLKKYKEKCPNSVPPRRSYGSSIVPDNGSKGGGGSMGLG